MTVRGDNTSGLANAATTNLFEVEGGVNKINVPVSSGRFKKLEVHTNIRNFGQVLPRINELSQKMKQLPVQSDQLPQKDISVHYDENQFKIHIRSATDQELHYTIDVPEEDRAKIDTGSDKEDSEMPGMTNENDPVSASAASTTDSIEMTSAYQAKKTKLQALSKQASALAHKFSQLRSPSPQLAKEMAYNLRELEAVKDNAARLLVGFEGTKFGKSVQELIDVCIYQIGQSTRKLNYIRTELGEAIPPPKQVGFSTKDDVVRIRGNTVDLPDIHEETKTQARQETYNVASQIFSVYGALKLWGKLDAEMEIKHKKGEISSLTLVCYEVISGIGARLHVAFAGSLSLIASIIKFVPRMFTAIAIVHQSRVDGKYGSGFSAVAIAAANYFKLAIIENIGGMVRDAFKTAWFTVMGVPRVLVAKSISEIDSSPTEDRTSPSKYILMALKHITPREFEFWEARTVFNVDIENSKKRESEYLSN